VFSYAGIGYACFGLLHFAELICAELRYACFAALLNA
jgi:hypothetical protein